MRNAVAFLLAAAIAFPAGAQTFDDLARSPTGLKGQSVYLTGKVIQSQQDGDRYLLRVNITPERWGWKDTVLVAFTQPEKSSNRIVEGDIVDINGWSNGITSYKAVMGQTIQLPSIHACDVTLHTGVKWVSPSGGCP